jgi:hypothetical protein
VFETLAEKESQLNISICIVVCLTLLSFSANADKRIHLSLNGTADVLNLYGINLQAMDPEASPIGFRYTITYPTKMRNGYEIEQVRLQITEDKYEIFQTDLFSGIADNSTNKHNFNFKNGMGKTLSLGFSYYSAIEAKVIHINVEDISSAPVEFVR